MGLLFPFFHIGFLETVTIRDALPMAIPSGHRHYAGQKKSRCCHTKSKQETKQITGNVCACVTKLSLNNASFHKKYRESITTLTCGACDTCKQGGKGEPNHQRVSNTTCLGHDFKSWKQEVEWSTRAPRGLKIQMVSDVPRASARVVGTHQKVRKKGEREKAHGCNQERHNFS